MWKKRFQDWGTGTKCSYELTPRLLSAPGLQGTAWAQMRSNSLGKEGIQLFFLLSGGICSCLTTSGLLFPSPPGPSCPEAFTVCTVSTNSTLRFQEIPQYTPETDTTVRWKFNSPLQARIFQSFKMLRTSFTTPSSKHKWLLPEPPEQKPSVTE